LSAPIAIASAKNAKPSLCFVQLIGHSIQITGYAPIAIQLTHLRRIMPTSPKQDKSYSEATHRFNIWVGAVRSGKTFASIERFVEDLKEGPPGDAMVIGVNRTSIQRNILTHLYKKLGFPCPTEKSQKSVLYGRDVWFVGAPDVSAVSTIQGSTLALAYVDEATNLPEPFWKMLESRLSVPGAKLIATCNPEGPAHWLKKDYIDNPKLDLVHWNFSLEDNPTLDKAFKEQLKASYYGLWYNRYILGEWTLTSGAVYDCYDHTNEYDHPFPAPSYYVVGIDYGTTNATAAVLCAVTPNKWPQIRVEAEYYYDSAKRGRSKTDQELVRDIKDFIGYKNVSAIYVDPAAASFKIALRQAEFPVLDANNDVLLGIKICSKFIGGKNIVIQKGCTTLREQLQSYAWDSKAADRGEDKPVKKDDHCADALRYAVCSAFPEGEFSHPDENISYDQLRRKAFGEDGYGFINPAGGYF
jgi:PBSX family phage terminase large subunit